MNEARASWLSRGFEYLLQHKRDHPLRRGEVDFDVVIIGSGYGGAVAAAMLAGSREADGSATRVCVLERGNEYLPGMFPRGFSTLPRHARLTTPWGDKVQGERDGLFDIRLNSQVNALVANGLGGGSLINAGVMEKPDSALFDERWPAGMRGGEDLEAHYSWALERLGAQRNGRRNVIAAHPQHQQQRLRKHEALEKLSTGNAQASFRDAAITVAMTDGPNNSGVALEQCLLCGDCATGCNHGAKDSLDLNLLVEAKRQGAELYTGATVINIERAGEDNAWAVNAVHTRPELARRNKRPARILAQRVILAAGTLGSTEILMRSRQQGLRVSVRLGHDFSGNGDTIAVGFGQKADVNAVADEASAPGERRIGPTITGVVDHPASPDAPAFTIEEMAVPAAMRRIFEEIYTTTDCLHALGEADWQEHAGGHPRTDPLSVNAEKIRRTALYAVMADDGAAGELSLRARFEAGSDGALAINWPGLSGYPLYEQQLAALESMTANADVGGRVLANPAWRPLPKDMEFLLGAHKGPQLTVHPLGGCAMADSAGHGVVNEYGQVFTDNADTPAEVYENLAVLDGAIIPCALGTNPALTITAVAHRAVAQLAVDWGLHSDASAANADTYRERPRYCPEPDAGVAVVPTQMQFAERLRGEITLDFEGRPEPYMAEITLFFKDKPLADLIGIDSAKKQGDGGQTESAEDEQAGAHRRSLQVVEPEPWLPSYKRSQLRLLRLSDWQAIERQHLSGRRLDEALAAASRVTAPLSGELDVFGREPTTPGWRSARVAWSWLWNRGIRDLWQGWFPQPHERAAREQEQGRGENSTLFSRLVLGLKLASRAGEVRSLRYRLNAGKDDAEGPAAAHWPGGEIDGIKAISYRRRAIPLRQMMEVDIVTFPRMRGGSDAPTFSLVPEFLARKGLPLFRITEQQDMPQALADLLSLGAYCFRMMASIHVLSFRKPDLPALREAVRLPGEAEVIGLPEPEVIPIAIDTGDQSPDSKKTCCQLTRYARRDTTLAPVVLIHGYSASGTTFAHPHVRPNLATLLWHQDRDVWILDLRSSSGADTATENYSFEELAFADIPLAIEHVCQHAAAPSVDVIAHCMGAAMFSMAVLGDVADDDPHAAAVRALPGRIHSAVLSQVGPLVSLAPENVFRAYVFSYLKHFLPLEDYRFQPEGEGSLMDEALDRLLASLPYSDREFDLENPRIPWRRTPYTTTRHRMDLLYGRTFSLENLGPGALAHIDDLFGPFNVDSATQVAHFARSQCITDHGGNNVFVSRRRLSERWRFPTLSLHGQDNGLADVSTLGRMTEILEDAGCPIETREFEGFGHQDCLIGENAQPVFDAIGQFLWKVGDGEVRTPRAAAETMTVQVPWAGPVIGPVQDTNAGQTLPLSFAMNPALSQPLLLLALPLRRVSGSTREGYRTLDVLTGSDGAVCLAVHECPRDDNGWIKYSLPLPGEWASADHVLVLLVYDESPALDNALYGVIQAEPEPFKSFKHVSLDGVRFDTRTASLLEDVGQRCRLEHTLTECLSQGPESLYPGIVRLVRGNGGDRLSFALGSCQYPPGLLDQKPGFASYKRLATRLKAGGLQHPPELVVLTGDQIYVDPTAGLFDPVSLDERHVQPYRRWYRASHTRELFSQLPAFMMLDDHEIENDWGPLIGDQDNDDLMQKGRKHYLNFQRGPHQPGKRHRNGNDADLDYAFEHRGFHFYMADTRSQRTGRDAGNTAHESLLGNHQMQRLCAWLDDRAADAEPDRPCFIACPAMLFPRLVRAPDNGAGAGSIRFDGWEGYPDSFGELLRKISEVQLPNLVFLSGDAHLSCLARVQEQSATAKPAFWSVHGSPLYAPLPFANSQQADFRHCETFTLPPADGHDPLTFDVHTRYAGTGEGFALLHAYKQAGNWQVEVSFDRASAASNPVSLPRTPLPCDCAPAGSCRPRTGAP